MWFLFWHELGVFLMKLITLKLFSKWVVGETSGSDKRKWNGRSSDGKQFQAGSAGQQAISEDQHSSERGGLWLKYNNQ